jgi:hypothetical protein
MALAVALTSLRASPACATPVLFVVDYLTLSGESCLRSFCAPITPGGTFQKSFSLDSSLLSAPGSYDVVPTLAPAYTAIPGTTSFDVATTAVVAGGTVVDLVIRFSLFASNTTPIINITTYTSQSFTASDGSWSSSSSTSSNLSNSSGHSEGSYAIQQVPEPGSLPLVAVGLVLVAGRRGRRSRRREEPARQGEK